MKKLIFISLLVVFFCKASDKVDLTWNEAVSPIRRFFGSQKIEMLDLTKAGITKLSENPSLPGLERLYLNKNEIRYIDPETFRQFLTKLPELRTLNLSDNPLTQENVSELRKVAEEVATEDQRVIEVIWLSE